MENKGVSLANTSTFDDSHLINHYRVIENNKNNRGPRIDPSGTPAVTSAQEEACALSTSLCFLFFENSATIFRSFIGIPFF